jgi:hypothetical protein
MHSCTDAELWERARAGDAEAFGDLYERHARAVQTYCLWRSAASGQRGRRRGSSLTRFEPVDPERAGCVVEARS